MALSEIWLKQGTSTVSCAPCAPTDHSISSTRGFPGGSAGQESAWNTGDLGSIPGLGRSPGEGIRLPTPVFWPGKFRPDYTVHGVTKSRTQLNNLGFPGGSACKESTCSVEDLSLIPGFWRSPGEGKGYPLQYPGLKNSLDCIVHGVAKSRTRLSDFHFTFCLFVLVAV